jgi:hypothetical protein
MGSEDGVWGSCTCSSGVGFHRRPRMVSMVGEWCMCLRFALSGLLLFDV